MSTYDYKQHYTDDEWNYLYQPYDWKWPDGWRERRTLRSEWEPELRRICEETRRPFDDAFVPVLGSHAVFLFPTFVVKIHARYSPIWFPREVEALTVLGRDGATMSPELIGFSDREKGRDGFPYIVMARSPGVPWFAIRDCSPHTNRLSAVQQMAGAVKAIHQTDPSLLTSYSSDATEWVAIMHARAAIAPEYLKKGLPLHFHDQIAPYIDEHLEAITADFTPTFITTDINSSNTLFLELSGSIELTGQIDFGDMEVGPLEYEWPSLIQKGMRYNGELARTFFAAYGLTLPFSDEQLRRLKIYSLLHRFPTFSYFAELNHPEITSLDALLEKQWECVG